MNPTSPHCRMLWITAQLCEHFRPKRKKQKTEAVVTIVYISCWQGFSILESSAVTPDTLQVLLQSSVKHPSDWIRTKRTQSLRSGMPSRNQTRLAGFSPSFSSLIFPVIHLHEKSKSKARAPSWNGYTPPSATWFCFAYRFAQVHWDWEVATWWSYSAVRWFLSNQIHGFIPMRSIISQVRQQPVVFIKSSFDILGRTEDLMNTNPHKDHYKHHKSSFDASCVHLSS